jgi:uncharacterized protein
MALVRDNISIGSQRRKTPEGFLIAPAHIGRVGVLQYDPGDPAVLDAPAELRGQNRPIRILRSASEVFDAKSMHSFAGRPVTNEHSASKVTSLNFRDHIVGVVGSAIVKDGDKIKADLTIYDAAVIEDIERGKCELSQGYDAETDWTGGTDPEFGAYDGAFKRIVGNHVAITSAARSGHSVRILDATNKGAGTVVKRNINGVEIDIPDNVVGVIDSYLNSYAETAKRLNEATGKIATLEKTIADNAAKLASVTDSAYIDARVKERAALVDVAKRLVPSIVCDGLDDTAIRAAVVSARGIKVDGVDAVRGAFEALATIAPVVSDAAKVTDSINKGSKPEKTGEEIYNEARNAFIAKGAN